MEYFVVAFTVFVGCCFFCQHGGIHGGCSSEMSLWVVICIFFKKTFYSDHYGDFFFCVEKALFKRKKKSLLQSKWLKLSCSYLKETNIHSLFPEYVVFMGKQRKQWLGVIKE